jgi:hypothetical protein
MIRHLAIALVLTVAATLLLSAPASANAAPVQLVQTPERIKLGKIGIDEVIVKQLTVTNTGTEPVQGFQLSFSQNSGNGGFTEVDFLDGTCGPFISVILEPGESCGWGIQLTAGVRGRSSGELCVFGGAGDIAAEACSRFSAVIGKACRRTPNGAARSTVDYAIPRASLSAVTPGVR